MPAPTGRRFFIPPPPAPAQTADDALFEPGNIALGDAQRVGDLLLGVLRLVVEAEAQLHDAAFPGRQPPHRTTQGGALGAALQFLADLRVVARQHVHQQQLVAVGVGVQRLVYAGVLPPVRAFAQVH